MDFHEEVYTSAPQLLDGGSHLGIVAQSRGFPKQLEPLLNFQRSYRILEQLPLNAPDTHPPRVIVGPLLEKDSCYCLTQVVYAGADHTGRTRPLAHHLVFRTAEMRAARISPASIIANAPNLLYRTWTDEPQWIDPPRTVIPDAYPRETDVFPAADWKAAVGIEHSIDILALGADVLLAFPTTHKQLVICIPVSAATSAVMLMADLLATLPISIQLVLTGVSHVVDPSDNVREAALSLTYPNTPFLLKCLERQDSKAPILLDLTRTDNSSITGMGPYGLLIRKYLRCNRPAKRVKQISKLYDDLGLGSDDAKRFQAALELHDALKSITSVEDVRNVGAKLAEVASYSKASRDHVERWCLECFTHIVPRIEDGEVWLAKAIIALDAHWPGRVRELAIHEISNQNCVALPSIITSNKDRSFVRRLLAKAAATDRELVAKWIAQAIGSTSDFGYDVVVEIGCLLVESTENVSAVELISWLEVALDAAPDEGGRILDSIDERLRDILISGPQIDEFHALANKRFMRHEQFTCRFYIPFLQRSLSCKQPVHQAHRFAWCLIDQALGNGSFADQLLWLRNERKDLLSNERISEWQATTSMNDKSDQLNAALSAAGLLPRINQLDEDRGLNGTRRASRPMQRDVFTSTAGLSAVLAVCVVFLQAVNSLEQFGEPLSRYALVTGSKWISPAWMHVVAFTGVGFWIISEIIFRFVHIRLDRMRVVGIVRRVVTAILGLAYAVCHLRLLLALYPLLKAMFSK